MDDLVTSLWDHLLAAHYEVDSGEPRRSAVWMMHPSWYDDCKKLLKWGPDYSWLLGSPVWVSEDYGVPELVSVLVY